MIKMLIKTLLVEASTTVKKFRQTIKLGRAGRKERRRKPYQGAINLGEMQSMSTSRGGDSYSRSLLLALSSKREKGRDLK
jgi:hypothetical protein